MLINTCEAKLVERVPRFLLRRKDCIFNASLSFSEVEVVHKLNKSINKVQII